MKEYRSKFASKETDLLFEAILSLENQSDCYKFFEDVCTIKEIGDMAQRLQVAKLLLENKTYAEIEEETSASAATISRINKCINYGTDGYKETIERVKSK